MHQNGKDDLGAEEASALGSNAFPLASRSTMKRPFSLASEREHQPSLREHFRTRGFRSRSKTIHSDTIRSFQYRDFIGQSSALVGFASQSTDRSTLRGAFDFHRRKSPSNSSFSSDKKTVHLALKESVLDEEMAIDEDESINESLDMLIDRKDCNLIATHKRSSSTNDSSSTLGSSMLVDQNTGTLDCTSEKALDRNSNPTTSFYSSIKASTNILYTHSFPSPIKSEPFNSSNSVLNCKKAATISQDRINATADLANENSLSPLAVPKSVSLLSECRASSSISTNAYIPTEAEKAQFQRSLDSATSLVFHRRSGLPLTSSPAPIRKSGTCFDFDSSLTSVNAIRKALFQKDPDVRDSVYSLRSRISLSASNTTSALLGNFEESVLNGRLEPASIVNGFTAEIGASGTFCPKHKTLPVTVFFYALQDSDKGEKISSPYLGHINLGPKGYHVPRQGTVQVTLFNPNGTVVKMFVVRYNLSDMPPNSRTFLRQRTLFMPSDANENHADNRKWLRYLIHLRFQSSKSGRIRLHTDIRILVFRKHDLDVATLNGGVPYELRSFVQMPSNPKYSKNIKC